MAAAAIQVGLDAAFVADLHMGDISADSENFDTEFVAEDAREFDEGHLGQITAHIGAADADGVDADEGFTRAGSGGFGDVDGDKLAGGDELKGAHEGRDEKGVGSARVTLAHGKT